MERLPGFVWPVPRAFASAVSTCRFEQGDVLYDVPEAYASWGPGPGCWVQVLDPPRTARAAPPDAEGNRFAANWGAPVTIELGIRSPASARTLRCTQGRLFTCLWRGDPGLLEDVVPGAPDELRPPAMARELQKELAVAVPAVRQASRRDPEHSTAFVCVVDEASEASLAKARAIAAALAGDGAASQRGHRPGRAAAAGGAVEIVDLAPAEAEIPGGDDFHPALRVRGFVVECAEPAQVEAWLKRALYAPTRTSGDGAGDRFKLDRHGLLVPPEGTAAASAKRG